MRESEQVMNSASGRCPSTSRSKSARWAEDVLLEAMDPLHKFLHDGNASSSS
jgi:hypothetical protein